MIADKEAWPNPHCQSRAHQYAVPPVATHVYVANGQETAALCAGCVDAYVAEAERWSAQNGHRTKITVVELAGGSTWWVGPEGSPQRVPIK